MVRDNLDMEQASNATDRTLEDLEGAWDAPPAEATHLITTARKLRRRPLSALGDEDLRLLIGQHIGLSHLVPLALDRLRSDPLAAFNDVRSSSNG